jgi:curved DNA-binding protein CbpA
MDIEKYFEILKVSPDSSQSEVTQAHRDLVNVWHPDRFSHNDRLRGKAEEELKKINLAREEILQFLSFEKERLKVETEEKEGEKGEFYGMDYWY